MNIDDGRTIVSVDKESFRVVGTHTGPWTFEQALTCMEAGGKVRRKDWPYTLYVAIHEWASGRRELLLFGAKLSIDGTPAAIGPFLGDSALLLANDWESVA